MTVHIRTDVQLMAQAVLITADDVPGVGQLTLVLDHPEFDTFAAQVAEAALAKRGREAADCHTSDLRIGDYLASREIINVRHNHPTTGMTTVNLRPFGHLLLHHDAITRVERPIQ